MLQNLGDFVPIGTASLALEQLVRPQCLFVERVKLSVAKLTILLLFFAKDFHTILFGLFNVLRAQFLVSHSTL